MKERPILFSAPMVRALLDGSKTQSRRPLRVQPFADGYYQGAVCFDGFRTIYDGSDVPPAKFSVEAVGGGAYMDEEFYCPFGQPGDRLWVRETFFAYGRWVTRFSEKKGRDEWHFIDMTVECDRAYQYDADAPDLPLATGRGGMPGWWRRPAIFMPRAACRLVDEIVSVRVERLNDCSADDARAEGVLWDAMGWMDYEHTDGRRKSSSQQSYQTLWESINGAGSWAANPWVWVVEFKPVNMA